MQDYNDQQKEKYSYEKWELKEELIKLKALTKEFAEGIVNNYEYASECGGDLYCIQCGSWIDCNEPHSKDCLTIKAQQHLDSIKE